jgi:DNA processing protein
MKARLISPQDAEWPVQLNELGPCVPPERLRVAGLPLEIGRKSMAVVGSRRPTAAGVEATQRITEGLAEAGFAIVSGLAVGIDAVAHRTALEAGAYTVAVLGCGLDVNYPRRNASLRRRIAECGTLVTEYDDTTQPHPHNFPRRNRIIAGLVTGVVFVEGGVTSGGRITARCALDANRQVFAVPGSIRNPMAQGPNELIRTSQAALVTEVQHIFDDLASDLIRFDAAAEPGFDKVNVVLNDSERMVLDYLDDAPSPVDAVATAIELPAGDVALALSGLELRGLAGRDLAGYSISSQGARVRAALQD